MTDVSLRIASLVPSATEICCALGLMDNLVGISHSCDYPPAICGLPVLTSTAVDPTKQSKEIDDQVLSLLKCGESIYYVNEERLKQLNPTVVLTQEACDLCAVSLPEVRRVAKRLNFGDDVRIVSLAPQTLDDVLTDFLRVGEAVGLADRAASVVAEYRRVLQTVQNRQEFGSSPRVLVIEWLDPLIVGGHWIPELVGIAGGEAVLGTHAAPAPKIEWDAVVEADPDIVMISPCGFRIEQTVRELPDLFSRSKVASLRAVKAGNVFVADGHAYFNCPGPRLIATTEILAEAISLPTNRTKKPTSVYIKEDVAVNEKDKEFVFHIIEQGEQQ